MSYICIYKCRIFARWEEVLKTLESKMKYRLARSKGSVFILRDFFDLSDRDQVGRVLRKLIADQVVVKIGYGLYAKARVSSVTGNVVPEKTLVELARESLIKLGVSVSSSTMEQSYNKGETTQVPTGRVIGVKGRVSRKIGYNGKYIKLEQVA